MRLTVETSNKTKFNVLISFLRGNGYKVQVHEDASIKDEDWCMPGRPATSEEHEAHAQAMDNDPDEGTEASVFFDNLIREIDTWK